MAIYKKIEDLPDAYTEMLVNAASKVMNATQILQNFAVVFFVSVTEPFAVSRGLFLCPKGEKNMKKDEPIPDNKSTGSDAHRKGQCAWHSAA